jgi:glycosidase
MWGADDPDDRKPMVWADMDYESETHHPFGEDRPADDNNFDEGLFSYYQKLAKIRNQERVLKNGKSEILHHDPERKVVLFSRFLDGETIYVLLNRSEKQQPFDLTTHTQKTKLSNLMNGDEIHSEKIEIAPVSGIILK